MSDLFKDVRVSLSERLTNPFFGSFVVSWIIINWRLWAIILLDSAPIADRLNQVDSTELAAFSNMSLHVYPAVAAFSFVVVMPWVGLLIDIFRNPPILLRKKQRKEFVSNNIDIKLELSQKRTKLNEEEEGFDRRRRNLIERERIVEEREAKAPTEKENIENKRKLRESEENVKKLSQDLETLILVNSIDELSASLKKLKQEAAWPNSAATGQLTESTIAASLDSSVTKAQESQANSNRILANLKGKYSRYTILSDVLRTLSTSVKRYAEIVRKVESLNHCDLEKEALQACFDEVVSMFKSIFDKIAESEDAIAAIRRRSAVLATQLPADSAPNPEVPTESDVLVPTQPTSEPLADG